MTTSDYLESLQDDLDTIVNTLELEEGSNFSDIATMVENGEISKGGGGGQTDVYRVETIAERNALNPNEGDICIVYRNNINYFPNGSIPAGTKIEFPTEVTITIPEGETAGEMWGEMRYTYMFDEYDEDTETQTMINYQINISLFGTSAYITIDYSYDDGETSESYDYYSNYTSEDGVTFTLDDQYGPSSITVPYTLDLETDWADYLSRFGEIKDFEFGLYQYKNSSWGYLDINISGDASNIVKNKTAYTNNGNITGVFPNMNSLDDIKTLLSLETAKYVLPQNSAQLFYQSDMNYLFAPLDASNVTNMASMLAGCKNLREMTLLDTHNVTNMSVMFGSCASLTTIPLLDTSSVTTMSNMFSGCSSLATIPLLDTSNVTDMNNMFSGCSSLTTIPLLDTSSVTTMQQMFYNCSSLTTIPLLDTSSVTNMPLLFQECSSLVTIPLLDTSGASSLSGFFMGCRNLTSIPLLDTSNVTNMGYMFTNCSSLTTIPLLDTSNVTNMTVMFSGCTSLNNNSLDNILKMCANATRYNGTKTLKTLFNVDMSAYYPAATIQSLSNYNDFVAAGWSIGW